LVQVKSRYNEFCRTSDFISLLRKFVVMNIVLENKNSTGITKNFCSNENFVLMAFVVKEFYLYVDEMYIITPKIYTNFT